MSKILLIDLFRVLLFPKDLTYFGDLDPLYLSKYHLPDYSFSQYFEINTELLDYLHTLSPTIYMYLFTAAHEFMNSSEAKETITPIFKSVYSTQSIGMRKTDIESYQYICSDLQVLPRVVVYVGDNSSNVSSAITAGVQAFQFVNNSQIITKLSSIFMS